MSGGWREKFNVERVAKIVTMIVSVGGLIWGGATFLLSKQLEARRPYLDYQLELYKATAQTVAKLATSDDVEVRREARKQFYELYWGELVLVESPAVESKMVKFEQELRQGSSELKKHAYYLVHELRSSLANSWGVKDWKFTRDKLEQLSK